MQDPDLGFKTGLLCLSVSNEKWLKCTNTKSSFSTYVNVIEQQCFVVISWPIQGFFTGLGKGVVGTVTKPVAGVLDFAAGAASAVRDTSRSSSRVQPSRVRKPRVCQGPGGLLPAYSEEIASGQKYLHKINDNNYNEM